MDKLIKYTILTTIAGVILAFNMYHADYKLLVAQAGTIVLVALFVIARLTKSSEAISRGDCFTSFAVIIKNPIVWFFGVCILSFLMSSHKLTSWHELYKIGTWIVFGLIVARFSVKRLTEYVINIWLICAGIVAAYGILQFFGFDFMGFELPGGRIISTFGNATLLAGFLAMTLPIALTLVLTISKPASELNSDAGLEMVRRVLHVVVTFLLLSCLILTKSRAGVLAGAIGCSLAVMGLHGKTRRLLEKYFLVILISISVLLILPQVRHVIFDVILRKTARIYLWKDAVQMIRVSPLFGTGIGTFALYFPDFVTRGVLDMHPIEWEFVNHAHSEYLEILAEMGIVGLVVFLAAVVIIFKSISKPASEPGSNAGLETSLRAAFVTILVHNIVSVDMRYTSTGLFFWMISGIFIFSSKPALEPGSNAGLDRWLRVLIFILALAAIYFTIKPYVLVNLAKEQKFFADDKSAINGESKDYFNLGILYAKKRDFYNAKKYFIETIKEDFRHAGAFNNLGNISFYEGDAGRARALFHKALMYEPDNAEYMINFASACFKVNLMEEAMTSVEKALEIDPGNSRALYLLAQMRQ
jgi:O-antigen ligase